MVENAADETAIIEAVPGDQIFAREPDLQAKAKAMMARLQFDEIDVLVVERIGKNISGSGMDRAITTLPGFMDRIWSAVNLPLEESPIKTSAPLTASSSPPPPLV